MDSTVASPVASLLPALLIGVIYALIVYVVARKRRINPWGWTLGTLIPGFGLIVSAIFFLLTFLSVLDRLNALEDASKTEKQFS